MSQLLVFANFYFSTYIPEELVFVCRAIKISKWVSKGSLELHLPSVHEALGSSNKSERNKKTQTHLKGLNKTGICKKTIVTYSLNSED